MKKHLKDIDPAVMWSAYADPTLSGAERMSHLKSWLLENTLQPEDVQGGLNIDWSKAPHPDVAGVVIGWDLNSEENDFHSYHSRIAYIRRPTPSRDDEIITHLTRYHDSLPDHTESDVGLRNRLSDLIDELKGEKK